MRIASLLLVLAACGGSSVCAGCSDDGGGWTREDLPDHAIIHIASVSIDASPAWVTDCADFSAMFERIGINVLSLKSDAPMWGDSCAWQGDTLSCESAPYTMSVDFAARTSVMTKKPISADTSCVVTFSVESIEAVE